MKIPPRLLHVARNLLAQRVDGGELYLVAQTPQEADFDFCFRRELEGMEVEQVGLNGK